MKLKPYSEYKDSGLPWLGKIPAHWNVRRNKLFLREVDERSIDGSEDLLTVSQYTGVTRRRDRLSYDNEILTNAASLVGYKSVRRGDIAVNIMLAWNGSLGTSSIDGIVSPAYCVYRASSATNPWFLHYLFRTSLFTGVFKTVSTGVVDSRLRLYPDVFFRLPSLLPPLEEQNDVVRFLDHQDLLIRRFIHAKRRMIELLNEQKQAIINQAVTRGLDPNVRLRPSGIDWLGEVPEHWSIWKIGHLARVGNGSTPLRGNQKYWTENGYPLLNSSCVHQSIINVAEQFVTDLALRECHLPKVSPGSVLVAITGQGKTRGTASVLAFEATINQHIAYITPWSNLILSEYLHLLNLSYF